MGEKSGGGATTAEERAERINFAVRRICTYPDEVQAVTAICGKFGCDRRTGNRYLRAAKALIGAGLPGEIEGWRTMARTTLMWLLEKEGEDAASIRATLKQIIDLLGLAAPTRSEMVIAERPRDTISEWAARPDLLERQLALEEELEDARSNPVPVEPGAAGIPAVAIPGTSEGVAEVCDEAAARHEIQSPDRPDACPAREIDLQ